MTLFDGTVRALACTLIMLILAVAVIILVIGLRDAVDTSRDVIDHAPTSATCWACGRLVEQEGDTACSTCLYKHTHKKEKKQ